MDIPNLVQQALGDEEIQAGVSLGDEDAICLTPTRTLVYNGEGLLSDEQVEEYPHDVEQIYVKDGRRKRKFVLEYIDGTRSFTVPSNRGEKVLKLLLEGVLRLESVIESRESLVGVYLFSELTLVIAEGRVVKHIGEPVWNEDYEVYAFEDVTRLDFERASVATSIVLDVDGRPQRVKVPNDNAPIVRQALEKALFAYFDVSSVEELNRVVDDGADDTGGVDDDETDDLTFGSGIDPLVTDHEDEDPLEGSADAFSDEPGAGVESSSATQDGTQSPTTTAETGQTNDEATASANVDQQQSSSEPETASTSQTDAAETAESSGSSHPGATETDTSESPSAETSESASAEIGEPQSAETGESVGDADTSADEWTFPATEHASDGERESAAGDTDSSPEATTSQSTQDANTVTADDDSLVADPETAGVADAGVSREEFEAVADRVDELTEAVDRQNELLKRQHRAIKQLVQQFDDE